MGEEKKIEEKIKKFLKERNIYFNKNLGTIGQLPGRPDIEAVCRGKYLAIEVKAPGKKMSEAQKVHARKIIKNGGIFILADNYGKFVNDFAKEMGKK